MFIDSHAHIDGPEFDEDRPEMLKRAQEAGVDAILNVGTGDPRVGVFERAVAFGEQHANVYTAIGVHPHDSRHYDDPVEKLLNELSVTSPKIIAWGEIGLDFHYDNSPREIQLDVFGRQLRAARRQDLPVIIHTREAERETISTLEQNFSGATRKGIFHCFSGSQQLADAALDLGFLISFSGIITFKKAEELRSVAKRVPLNRLLVETDCPFLTPVPHRGKRNEPAYVAEVSNCLAALHGTTVEQMARVTSENFRALFGLTA